MWCESVFGCDGRRISYHVVVVVDVDGAVRVMMGGKKIKYKGLCMRNKSE